MAKTKRLVKSFYRLILPVFILLFAAIVAASVWLVHTASNPPQAAYLVTPELCRYLAPRALNCPYFSGVTR